MANSNAVNGDKQEGKDGLMKTGDETAVAWQGLGREVPLRDIDRELRRMWDVDEARTNASLMNLVVFSADADSLAGNSEVIRELTREHACRAILVSLDRTQPQVTTRAWVTAHCHLAGGRKAVCCEQVAFALTGRSQGRLRNIVFAHLNSDLPLVFWWQGELSDIFVESLYGVIDRLIIDSACWAAPVAGWERLAAAVEDGLGRLVIQDLEWTRGYPWRLAVASMFDDPRLLGGLDGISRVRIVHRAGHRSAALQLLAWLVVQAGWRRGFELGLGVERHGVGVEGFSFEQAAGQPVAVVLETRGQGPPLAQLTMEGEGLRIEVKAHEGDPYLHVTGVVDGRREQALLPAGPESACGLVGDLLARGGKNTLFRKVLPVFRDLLTP